MRLLTNNTHGTRVAHVTTVHPAHDNRILHKECSALAQSGWNVHLVARVTTPVQRSGVTIHPLRSRQSRLSRMLAGPVDAWRTLRAIKPALIHVHDPELIPLAIAYRFVYRIAAVYDAHEDLAAQVVAKKYIPRWLRSSLRLFALSLELAADRLLSGIVIAEPALRKNFKHNRSVALVQNFPWLRDFPPPTESSIREENAAYIGAVNEDRGAREMVTAIERCTSHVQLLVAGPANPPEVIELFRSSSRAEYLGIIPVDDIPALLSRSAIGLAVLHPLPNYIDAQSTKLFEYMAASIPFITSNFPSWVKLLGSYDCGIFVDPLDPAAIAGAIDELMADRQRAAEMGERGRAALIQHFIFENEAEKLTTFVAKTLETLPK